MKKLLLLFLTTLLPMLAMADDFAEIDGINYYLDAEKKVASVTSKPGKYSGEIDIPESVTYNSVAYSVTSIMWGAFCDCTGLTSVTIGNSVTSIGDNAFYWCTGLTSVTIGNSVTSIGDNAFSNTGWYNNQPDGILYLDNCLLGYKGVEPTGEVTIQEGTRVIANVAFFGCSGLTSVTIPNSVTSIGERAFSGCTGLTSVHISDLSAWYKTKFEDNPLFYAHHLYLNNQEVTNLVIPEDVTSIGRLAFNGCTGLTSVTIGNSVTSIGDNAFSGCSGLTSVTIPNSVTSIGERAFSGCSGLTSLSIGEKLSSIGQDAFNGCTGLTLIESFNPNPPECSLDNTFRYVDFTIPLYIPSGSYLKYKAAVGWRQFVVMREMGGDSDVYLSINDGSHGNVNIKVDEKNPCVTLKFEPDNGWHLYSVKLNDENVTAEVGQDGKYTTPAINTNSKLVVVYAQGASSAPSINSNRIDLSSNDNELIVSGTTGGERIAVYTMNGVCVSKTMAKGRQTTIPLATRQNYIVKVGDLILKYCY